MPDHFTLLTTESAARRGRLRTAHGVIETPAFMPVGTQGTVKAATPAQLHEIGAQIVLSNTYHLNLRPGPGLIRELGGLHKFMGWDGPILTDSGGFQVFSLAKLRKITDEGVSFRSHLDGAEVFLGPRECMDIQAALGSDIAMVLDECPPWPASEADVRAAVERTLRWAKTCREAWHQLGQPEKGHHLFAIVQGSAFAGLRRECAEALAAMDFPGYAIGGVSVGEPEPEMLAAVGAAAPHLPADKPRYVMGVGTPPQLLKMIGLGADMFDCVMPTRLARHGCAFTPDGPINLKNAKFARDAGPLVEGLDNYTCRHFTRAYLRHLVMCGEILGCTLLTLHNLHFYLDLMTQARAKIEKGEFEKWAKEWCTRYEAGVHNGDATLEIE
ncbi:MAG TPA: tRNA guanosine(34) transglycosylase Tgt [Opitutales bacterium]|nr:tRNA guanosine(34) transglycosylase Tgt [Opitutales bacterium]